MIEEISYPIQFDACPACKSTRRIIEMETQKAIEAGDLRPDAKIPILATRTLIFNPNTALVIEVKRVPALYGYYDVCADCGTLYCIAVEKSLAEVQLQKQPPPSFGGFGFPVFGKG